MYPTAPPAETALLLKADSAAMIAVVSDKNSGVVSTLASATVWSAAFT
jgi:hypothetical protein